MGRVDRGGRFKGRRISKWKKRHKMRRWHVEYLELRLVRHPTFKKRVPKVVSRRRAVVYLVPKEKTSFGDVILVVFPRRYVAFLDHYDLDELSNGERWYTLHYDCMSLDFVFEHAGKMTHPDFPWDEIAQKANSCMIEISIEEKLLKRINAKLLQEQQKAGLDKPLQEVLSVGSWWGLSERGTPAPHTLLGIKHEPAILSDDPTTIVTSGWQSNTVIGEIAFPDVKLLKALIAISHPGELSKRYPGR